MTANFPYRFDRRYKVIWSLLGARSGRDGVTLTDDGQFIATYGRFRVETPLANVSGAHITRDYRWYAAIGTRLSFADDGLTFGTSTDHGVCVHFHEKVKRVLGRKDHSALTVTVDDAQGLVRALGYEPEGPDPEPTA